jgi:regulator of replication initiation timing
MLNHPDIQVQYIFASLEAQRDNLLVENGNMAAELAKLRQQLESPIQEAQEAQEAPAN